MEYIAHIRELDGEIQTVAQHLLEVRAMAEAIGDKLGVRHIAGLAGMLHDMGKFSEEFRQYILEAVNNPTAPPKRGSVDHSTAGGKLLFEQLHSGSDLYLALLAEIVGNAIISHHSYLQDYLNGDFESPYLRRVQDKCLSEFPLSTALFYEQVMDQHALHQYVQEAAQELKAYLDKDTEDSVEHTSMLLTKYIFSTLIDADRTNTRQFEEFEPSELAEKQQVEPPSDTKALFMDYEQKLLLRLATLQEGTTARTSITELRQAMSEQCSRFADKKPPGIYTLSIPTGGGKTLASLRYALRHAQKYNKERIIYVVPFTTIIEQNANEIRELLQDDEHILEHHSNVVEADKNDEMDTGKKILRQKLKLAKDNWDSPIIFTTMVQFLNVFYAGGSRNIRRLHNLSNSVIIFDEVQKVPISCVSLLNQALNFLKLRAHATMVLCTATQPELDYVKHRLNIDPEGEMVENLPNVVQAFTRINLCDRATGETFTTRKLADFIKEQLGQVRSVLVILNTKGVVKALYQQLDEENIGDYVYHLSTSMCAAHRYNILKEIRERLRLKLPVVCISTQLIEAGVDVSFQCVIRSLAGLDSIAQAAGRCNRHGEEERGQVYVIDHEEEKLDRLKEIEIGKRISKELLVSFKEDNTLFDGNLLSPAGMERFFQGFYSDLEIKMEYRIRKLNKNMTELLSATKGDNSYYLSYCNEYGKRPPLVLANSYGTAAEHFQVIEQATTNVLVPYDKGKEIIADLNGNQTIADLSTLLREAQQYTVSVYSYGIDQLSRNKALVKYLDGKLFAVTEGAYNEKYGLDMGNESEMGFFGF